MTLQFRDKSIWVYLVIDAEARIGWNVFKSAEAEI